MFIEHKLEIISMRKYSNRIILNKFDTQNPEILLKKIGIKGKF